MSDQGLAANGGSTNPFAGVRHWDAQSRITTRWDGLHKDLQLWLPEGDVFVYLYERGHSQRKPSFSIRMSDLRSRHFDDLVQLCTVCQLTPQQATTKAHSSTLRARMAQRRMTYDLYLPVPPGLDNAAALDYHLNTRNFFAWMYHLPMVGKSLGRALVAVLERIDEYRPYIERNRIEMMAYLDRQGYYDFRMCADHSLAALYFAEIFEMPTLWRNAFAHSVGMSEMLYSSGEYQNVSRVTRAMITKANLDMETYMERVTGSLGTMFEDLTSGVSMGLGRPFRDHLDRFRSFLITVHIERHGFWPPRNLSSNSFSKEIFLSLYREFRCLFQFLVDPDSSDTERSIYRTGTGIDVDQVIETYDLKHDFDPLPYHRPLIPRDPSHYLDFDDDEQSQSSRNKLNPLQLNPMRGKKGDKLTQRRALWKSLADATNYDPETYKTLIIRRYIEFEQETLIEVEEEKIKMSIADGRRVRWLLVYAILQVLVSVVKAPADVNDTEGIDYPLCCRIPKVMPWNMEFEHLPYTTAAAGPGSDGGYYLGSPKAVTFDVNEDAKPFSSPTANGSSVSLTPSVEDASSWSPTISSGPLDAETSRPLSAQSTQTDRSKTSSSKSSRRISLSRFLGRKLSSRQTSSDPSDSGTSLDRSIEQGSTQPEDLPEDFPEDLTPTDAAPMFSSYIPPSEPASTFSEQPDSQERRVSPVPSDDLRLLANLSPVSSLTDSLVASDSTTASSLYEDQVSKFPSPPIMQSVTSTFSSPGQPTSTNSFQTGPTTISTTTTTSMMTGQPLTTSTVVEYPASKQTQGPSDLSKVEVTATDNGESSRPSSTNTIRPSTQRPQSNDRSDPSLRSNPMSAPQQTLLSQSTVSSPTVTSVRKNCPLPIDVSIIPSTQYSRVTSATQQSLAVPRSPHPLPDSPTYPPGLAFSPPGSRDRSVSSERASSIQQTPRLDTSQSKRDSSPSEISEPSSSQPQQSQPQLNAPPQKSGFWPSFTLGKPEINLPPSPTSPSSPAPSIRSGFSNTRTPPSPPTTISTPPKSPNLMARAPIVPSSTTTVQGPERKKPSKASKLLSYWKLDPTTTFNPPAQPTTNTVKVPSNVRIATKDNYNQSPQLLQPPRYNQLPAYRLSKTGGGLELDLNGAGQRPLSVGRGVGGGPPRGSAGRPRPNRYSSGSSLTVGPSRERLPGIPESA